MDRRQARASRSVSRSPRRRRRRSRSFSRSPSPRRSVVNRQQSAKPSKSWGRGRPAERYYQRQRSPSERRQERGTKWVRDGGNSARGFNRRSRSRSPQGHTPSRHQFRSSVRRRSPSPRVRVFKQHQRSRSPRRRSPSPYNRKAGQHRRSPSPRRRSPTPRRRSPSPRRRSPSLQQWSNVSRRRSVSARGRSARSRGRSPSPSPRPRRRSPSLRGRSSSARRSSSVHRHSRSPRRNDWDRRSRSRSDSRPRQSEDADSRSGSSRGRSRDRSDDRASPEPLAPKLSPVGSATSAVPSGPQRRSAASATTLLVGSPPKADSAEEKQDGGMKSVTGPAREDRTTHNYRSLMHGSNGSLGSGQTHDGAHGYNHHANNRRLFVHDVRAPASSPATHGAPTIVKPVTHGTPTYVKPVPISDRVVTSSPHDERSSTTTPTRGAANHHTFSPVVNPILEKKREAQRESHRAYLKSNSEYNRAEVNYVTNEAELRLAEFWLEIRTKNLKDVGKRIEVHDWNFQKITAPGGSDEA